MKCGEDHNLSLSHCRMKWDKVVQPCNVVFLNFSCHERMRPAICSGRESLALICLLAWFKLGNFILKNIGTKEGTLGDVVITVLLH